MDKLTQAQQIQRLEKEIHLFHTYHQNPSKQAGILIDIEKILSSDIPDGIKTKFKHNLGINYNNIQIDKGIREAIGRICHGK